MQPKLVFPPRRCTNMNTGLLSPQLDSQLSNFVSELLRCKIFARLHHGRCSILVCELHPDRIPALFPGNLVKFSLFLNLNNEMLSKTAPFVRLISLINAVPTLRVICIFMSLSHDGVICQKQLKYSGPCPFCSSSNWFSVPTLLTNVLI